MKQSLTVRIDARILHQAKLAAANTARDLDHVVEQALRLYFAPAEQDELIAQLQGALDGLIPAAEAAMLRQYGLTGIPDDNLVVDLAIALERAKASRQ